MTTLGIDFDSIPLTPESFRQHLEKAQDDRVLATWNICDLNYIAKHNPEYDEVYQQYRNETKIADSTINKYNSTIDTFPLSRRKWHLSIDMYYSVVGLRDEDGNPATHVQDNLLGKAYRKAERGETGIRKWLRDEVKKVKRDPVVEKETLTATVGTIDDILRVGHQLPDGYEVKIEYVKVIEYGQSELEDEIDMVMAS